MTSRDWDLIITFATVLCVVAAIVVVMFLAALALQKFGIIDDGRERWTITRDQFGTRYTVHMVRMAGWGAVHFEQDGFRTLEDAKDFVEWKRSGKEVAWRDAE